MLSRVLLLTVITSTILFCSKTLFKIYSARFPCFPLILYFLVSLSRGRIIIRSKVMNNDKQASTKYEAEKNEALTLDLKCQRYFNAVFEKKKKLLQTSMSDTLWPHGLQPTRFFCSLDFPDKNTRVGCHFLFYGIFVTQGSNRVP